MKNRILNGLRAICKPGKIARYKLQHLRKKTSDEMITAASAIAAVITLFSGYPFEGVGDFLLSCFCCLLLMLPYTFLFTVPVTAGIWLIRGILLVPSWMYDYCDDRINHVLRRKKDSIKKAPRAEVGIKYFIERERWVQINHAKYLG